MPTTKYHTECEVPSGEVRARIEGAEEICNPIERTTIPTKWTPSPQKLPVTKPKSIHGVTHDSSWICRRGLPYWVSLGVEALRPVEAQ